LNKHALIFVTVTALALLSLAMPGAMALTYVSSCQALDTADETYEMSANIANDTLTDNCLNVTAGNVTLDCAGYYIKSNDAYAGVYSDQLQTTIKNCNISMGNFNGYGIRLNEANDSYIFNNILNNQRYGLYLTYVSDLLVENTTANSNLDGVRIISISDSVFRNSTFSGNSWSDFNVYGTTTDAHCNNLLENVIGSGGTEIKYYNYSVTLSGQTFPQLILCNADNSDLSNIKIWSPGASRNNDLSIIRTDNSVFTGINSSRNYYGLSISESSNNVFTNITARSSSGIGFSIYGSSNNIIENSTITWGEWQGIYMSFRTTTH